MPNQNLTYLFDKYFDKTATPAERDEFMQLLAGIESDETLYQLLEKAYERHTGELSFNEGVREKVLLHIFSTTEHQPKPKQRKIGYYRNWLKYAAVFLLLSLGVAWYFTKKEKLTTNATNLIVPGSNKAVLTLANGQKVVLDGSSNAVLQDGNIEIRQDKSGQLIYIIKGSNMGHNLFNTIETPRGGQYQVLLPDGTKVWLNATTTLRYPLSFDGEKVRSVELTGEAYFEVAKDKIHPFKVISNGQEVTVLGTHFNISAYADEDDVKTTLLEGSVKVNNLYTADKSSTILKPGQQAVLTRQNVNVISVDAVAAMTWKNGKFAFVDEPVESMMRKISRWYDVEVIYKQNVKDKLFTGAISRYEKIETLLETIESTNTVHFKIDGRRILVMN